MYIQIHYIHIYIQYIHIYIYISYIYIHYTNTCCVSVCTGACVRVFWIGHVQFHPGGSSTWQWRIT